MTIYNTRDLIPFVNQLEASISELNEQIADWNVNKYKIISSSTKVDSVQTTALSALIRADEAMAEIGTATFKSTANRGKRLEDTLNQLRNDVYEIAASVGSGGGGQLTDGMFYDELNNAIADVDVTIEDGLKLDYRLRDLQDLAASGKELADKQLYMPYKYEVAEPSTRSFVVPSQEELVFIDGEVTVLNSLGTPLLDEYLHIITGFVDPTGQITLSAVPAEPYTVLFPVQMKFKDIPEDFLNLFLQQIIQKNSKVMEIILSFEAQMETILTDIEYMKGVNWTPDFSIMKDHQDVVKEGITPKGLDIEVADGLAHVTFSYNDHPYLSHFILEKWDEESQKFIPYDGVNGIVNR